MTPIRLIPLVLPVLAASLAQAQAPSQPTPTPSTAPGDPQIEPQPQARPQPESQATPAQSSVPQPRVLTEAEQAELNELVSWQKAYFRAPEPAKVPTNFRRRAELGGLHSGDQGWTEAAFVAEVLRANPASVAGWCDQLADLSEPARGWWWTAVWQAQSPECAAALEAFANKPEGDPARLTYKWLTQKPQNILDRNIRGTQQLAMLWAAFYASGNDAFLVKTFEVIPDPDLSDPKLSDRAKARRLNTTLAARFQLASAAHADAQLMARLRDLAAAAPDGQREAILATLDRPLEPDIASPSPALEPTTPAEPK